MLFTFAAVGDALKLNTGGTVRLLYEGVNTRQRVMSLDEVQSPRPLRAYWLICGLTESNALWLHKFRANLLPV